MTGSMHLKVTHLSGVTLADRHNECCSTELLSWSCTLPLNIIEIHGKPAYNELWFHKLSYSCKTM